MSEKACMSDSKEQTFSRISEQVYLKGQIIRGINKKCYNNCRITSLEPVKFDMFGIKCSAHICCSVAAAGPWCPGIPPDELQPGM